MVFSTHIFLLLFLPVSVLLYFLVPPRAKNLTLLLISIVFYAWGAPRFVLLLLLATTAAYYLVRRMHRTANPTAKKLLCATALTIPLTLLLYFKYANFFIDNLNSLLTIAGSSPMKWTRVVLPIGISFFTFQIITYIIDVYRETVKPMEHLTGFLLYIMMFPQLIAGPIVRYGDIASQIDRRETHWEKILQGWYRFVIGLCKKVLIADVLGRWVDTVLLNGIGTLDCGMAWLAILAYTMQLYFDFSGYSDMAIGLGKIFGFDFPENFNSPYNSASVGEFWHRWHITLGTFMKHYLYIPLGGNRKSPARTYCNLWTVFLLSGLWHGAGWNFVVWGAWHGFWLVAERLGLSRVYEKIGKIPSVLFTSLVVIVGWVFFRIENLGEAMQFIGTLFSFRFSSPDIGSEALLILCLALLFSYIGLTAWGRELERKLYYHDWTLKENFLLWPLSMFLLMFCVGALGAVSFSPFIYFRF